MKYDIRTSSLLLLRVGCCLLFYALTQNVVTAQEVETIVDPAGKTWVLETPWGAFWAGFMASMGVSGVGWCVSLTRRIGGHYGSD